MEFTLIRCWEPTCTATFSTLNEMSTHHLDAHERPLPARETVWEAQAPRECFQPPYWRGAWQRNGVAEEGTP